MRKYFPQVFLFFMLVSFTGISVAQREGISEIQVSAASAVNGVIRADLASLLATDSVFRYDDGTAESGWGMTAGYSGYYGNLFPVGPFLSGEITSFDVWFTENTNGKNVVMTIDIFNESRLFLGSSFSFTAVAGTWISVPVNDIPFYGSFYGMVKWNNFPVNTNFLGRDEDGASAYRDLAYFSADSEWVRISQLGFRKGVFLIRAHVNLETVGMQEPTKQFSARIFPNPARHWVTVTSEKSITGIDLTDLYGNHRLSLPVNGLNSCRFNTGDLNPGSYVVFIRLKDRTVRQKLLILPN